jgi:hypothetical protein
MQYRTFIALLPGLALAMPALAAGPWRVVGEEDGVRVEQRDADSGPFGELRLVAKSEAALETLCDVVWGDGKIDPNEPNLKHREVLEEQPNMRITYEQVAVPVVADRDYVVKRTRMVSKNSCQVAFESVTDRGPKSQPGHVRIPRFYGSWTVRPTAHGSMVTYVIYSDPGGGVPPALARGPQRNAAKEWMRMILAKARRAEPRTAVR